MSCGNVLLITLLHVFSYTLGYNFQKVSRIKFLNNFSVSYHVYHHVTKSYTSYQWKKRRKFLILHEKNVSNGIHLSKTVWKSFES